MKITISGTPGAGDTTTTEKLAEKLGYKEISIGEIQKKIAKKQGKTPEELWEKQEKNPEELKKFNQKLDKKQKKIAEKQNNIIINGKLSAHHIPNADLKIFLDADIEERAKRALMRKKQGRKEFAETIDKGKKYKQPKKEKLREKIQEIKKRQNKETQHWEKLYGFNYIKDKDSYDLIIDTTNKKPNKVVKIIEKQIKKIQNDQ